MARLFHHGYVLLGGEGNVVHGPLHTNRTHIQITISLLEKAMNDSGKDTFLIDGFPRNEENRAAFESQVCVVFLLHMHDVLCLYCMFCATTHLYTLHQQTGTEPAFILFFDCPEDVMTQRLLGRNQGRSDDNIETIKKRFKVGVDFSSRVLSSTGLST